MHSGPPPSPLWQEERLVFISFPKVDGQGREKIPIKVTPLEKFEKPQF